MEQEEEEVSPPDAPPSVKTTKVATFATDNDEREYTTDFTDSSILPPERWETPQDPYAHRGGRRIYSMERPPINNASPVVVVVENERKHRKNRPPCGSRDELIRVLTELARLNGLLTLEENYVSIISRDYLILTGVRIGFSSPPTKTLTPEELETKKSLNDEYRRVKAVIDEKKREIVAVKADRNRLYSTCGFPTTGLQFGSKKMSERRREKIKWIYYLLTF